MGPHTLRNPSSIGEDRKPVPVNMSLIHYSHTTQKERIINVKIIRKEEDARKRTPRSGYRLLILNHVFIDIIYIYIYVVDCFEFVYRHTRKVRSEFLLRSDSIWHLWGNQSNCLRVTYSNAADGGKRVRYGCPM